MTFKYVSPVAALLILAFFTGCGPEAQQVSLDLISLQGVARQVEETGPIDLSKNIRYYSLARGWSPPYEAENSDGAKVTAAVGRESVLRYSVVVPAHRWLAFKARLAGKYGKLDQQQIEVYAGEEQIATLAVESGDEQELMFHIPPSVQQPGDNMLTFRFTDYAENPRYLASGSDRLVPVDSLF